MSKLTDFLIAERTAVAVILINAIAVFAHGRQDAHLSLTDLWFQIDYACVLYFLLEATLKIRRFGWPGYIANGWNRFDFLILLASLPVLAAPWVDLHRLALVPLLRMGRLFRLFRLLRFIPNRDHLINGIRRALKASVGIFLALLLVNVILAVGATLLFGDLAPEHFGNPMLACYSIFKVLTVEGWYEIPDLLSQRADHPAWAIIARIYFVMAVSVGGILGLSLANAVFVDEMMMDNTEDIEAKIDSLRNDIHRLHIEIRQLQTLPETEPDLEPD